MNQAIQDGVSECRIADHGVRATPRWAVGWWRWSSACRGDPPALPADHACSRRSVSSSPSLCQPLHREVELCLSQPNEGAPWSTRSPKFTRISSISPPTRGTVLVVLCANTEPVASMGSLIWTCSGLPIWIWGRRAVSLDSGPAAGFVVEWSQAATTVKRQPASRNLRGGETVSILSISAQRVD